jgi:hypothetical protein
MLAPASRSSRRDTTACCHPSILFRWLAVLPQIYPKRLIAHTLAKPMLRLSDVTDHCPADVAGGLAVQEFK